ncbi:MAG: hypothetical protein C0617_03220 [Desulfuromonas sp.]|uniref:TetR/AcrR family transcriptional regulator n=1 Tax=Desulfuromonas sp. TaxID=892 RepID=UPI000CAD7B0B|nr:TetR/AcrR family transcriptional regulator [Desulfuromonas sp.]PLX85705.1 MAG: hypothetical protein C0617_03220 [Desulfuromonas sp.]
MSGIRAAKKRETRKAILEAALRLFSEKGFEGTSMEELARAAGVGKGTIYGYFKAKDDIFLAYCEEEVEYAFQTLAETLDPEAPLLEQLMTLFMSQFDFVTRNHEFGRLMAREIAFPKEPSPGKSKQLEDRYLQGIGEVLERAKGRGELKEGSETFWATGHFYALYLVSLSGWYAGYLQDRREVEAGMRTLLIQALNGLGPQGKETRPEQDILDQIRMRFDDV